MSTDKSLYNLYLKEMKATGLQVNKKLAAFADSFANRVLSEPNNDIAKIYRQEVKAFNIVDDVAKTIQGGMINQTAIGYGILPDFSAEIMGNNSTANLKKIFGKTNGKKLSKSVYNSVVDSQKTIYQTIEKNSKLNKTWKETSSQVRKELKGSLKGYENLPKSIKKLEDIGQKALTSGDSRQFKKRLEKARLKIEDLSDNRALKQSYKSVFNQLEKAIDKNDKVLFEKGIKRATLAKNQSFAERTIITEQSRVFEQTRYNERVENELITAVKFNLSSSHKKVDQCDVIASYNSGLGSGIYSLKSQPAMPIHPNGVSFLTDILVDEVSQKQADKFKYNRNGIAEAAEQKNLSTSQIKDVENMSFQQTMRVDKKALTKIVKK